MDTACLEHCLTEEERVVFDRDGFLVVEDALPATLVDDLTGVVDRLGTHYRSEMGKGPHEALNLLDFVGKDEIFLQLLDWPRTFPKVWGILGWHIQLYHSHLIVTPPMAAADRVVRKRLGWHQDSGRLNLDLEGEPRPRISLKVAFFLIDTSETGSGNFSVVPGSHLRNKLEFPEDGVSDPKRTTPVLVKPGAAVFFDRRLWHSGGRNLSEATR